MNYGDLSVLGRAVLVLLRQVRAVNVWIMVESGYEDEERAAHARIKELDALLDEIAAIGRRAIEGADVSPTSGSATFPAPPGGWRVSQ